MSNMEIIRERGSSLHRREVLDTYQPPTAETPLAELAHIPTDFGRVLGFIEYSRETGISQLPEGPNRLTQHESKFYSYNTLAIETARMIKRSPKYAPLLRMLGYSYEMIPQPRGVDARVVTIPTTEYLNNALDSLPSHDGFRFKDYYDSDGTGKFSPKNYVENLVAGLVLRATPDSSMYYHDALFHTIGYATIDNQTVALEKRLAEGISANGLELDSRGRLKEDADELANILDGLSTNLGYKVGMEDHYQRAGGRIDTIRFLSRLVRLDTDSPILRSVRTATLYRSLAAHRNDMAQQSKNFTSGI